MPEFFKTFQAIQTGVNEKAFSKREKTAVLPYHATKRPPKHPWAWGHGDTAYSAYITTSSMFVYY